MRNLTIKTRAAAFAGFGVLATVQPALCQAGPSRTTDAVTVTARRPIVVTAARACPPPDATRYPATRAPQVVDSSPAQGARVTPGPAIVQITFDAPMSCYSEVTVAGGDDSDDPCEPAGTWLLPARRSWRMSCHLRPGVTYHIRFAKLDGEGYVGLSGRRAVPFELSFSTTDGAERTTYAEVAPLDPVSSTGDPRMAYVTCVDAGRSSETGGCRRERASPAPR